MTNQDKAPHPEQQHAADIIAGAKIAKALAPGVDERNATIFHVRATNRGFIDYIRNAGEEFDIPDHLFSPEWMEKTAVRSVPPPVMAPKE